MEKMRAVIQEDEAYHYAVEIALDWWIKNTLESSWQELVSFVYRCGEIDAADAMRKKLGKIIHLVSYLWPQTYIQRFDSIVQIIMKFHYVVIILRLELFL